MPANEAHLDAPRDLRRVAYRGGAFTDHLGGVSFVDSVAQSGMAPGALARLVGIGLPLDDLGPWEPPPAAEDAPPSVEPPALDAHLAAPSVATAPDDASGVSPAHAAPPAPSATPLAAGIAARLERPLPYTHAPTPTPGDRRKR